MPSFGGLLKIELPSKSTASAVGAPDKDWLVIEIDDDPIGTISLVADSIDNTPLLFLDVKYNFEETSAGFDWGDETNYDVLPQITVLVPTTITNTIKIANGCPDVEVRTFENGNWVLGQDTILSNVNVDGNFCQVVFESDHYSNKSVSAKKSTPSTAGSAGGTGNSAGAGAGAGGFGGILGTPLTINEVSYDKCDENIARILISTDAESLPSVTVHTTRAGSIAAILSDDQPYEELNKITRVDKYLYELPIASDETFLMIVVTE